MGRLDDLAKDFNESLKAEKKKSKQIRDNVFGLKVFQKTSKMLGVSVASFRALWDPEQEDPAYDIKLRHPELSHINTTGAVLGKWSHMLKPVRDIPHGLWETYLASLRLASSEYGRDVAALVFRIKGNTYWVMTNESLSIPQLQPVIQVTTPSKTGDIRILPFALYLTLLEDRL